MLLPLLLAVPLHQPTELLRDPDVWWHLADARALFATHHFAQADTFSFSVAGQRWANPEWLSEIPFWLGDRAFHLWGILLVTWLAVSANVLLVYTRSVWRSSSSTASFWASALAVLLMTVNSGPRTILFGYLALSIELVLIELAERGSRQTVWALPALFAVWVNLHGSWLIGLALFVVYVLCGAFSCRIAFLQQSARPPETQRRLWLALAASAGALFLNPYGWRLVWNPFDMMFRQKLNIASAQEWRPLDLSTALGRAALLAILLMLAANALRGRKWKLYELAFVLFAWYAAFDHMRFCFLAAILTTPYLAGDMTRSFSSRTESKPHPAIDAAGVAIAVLLIVLAMPSPRRMQEAAAQVVPDKLIEQIQPAWRTLNDANIGGMLAFQSRPSYIDTRLDIFEHSGVLRNYFDVVHVIRPFEVLDTERIDHVLMPQDSALAYLLGHTPQWRVIARQGQGSDAYVLFERASISQP